MVMPSIFANSISPYVWFWPGVLPLTLIYALPATVVAAILERPFVARAGVADHPRWYSFQANLVSLVLGCLAWPIAWPALYGVGPLWSLLAIVASILSEGWYYQWAALPESGRLKWRWIVAGNTFSSLVVIAVPIFAVELREAYPVLIVELGEYQSGLTWFANLGSIGVFMVAFMMPVKFRQHSSSRGATPQVSDSSTEIPVSQHVADRCQGTALEKPVPSP